MLFATPVSNPGGMEGEWGRVSKILTSVVKAYLRLPQIIIISQPAAFTDNYSFVCNLSLLSGDLCRAL